LAKITFTDVFILKIPYKRNCLSTVVAVIRWPTFITSSDVSGWGKWNSNVT